MRAINLDDSNELRRQLEKLLSPRDPARVCPFDLQSQIISTDSLWLSPLGYALYVGSTRCFAELLSVDSAAILPLNNEFVPIGRQPLDLMCELGYLGILRHYLPVYLEHREALLEQSLTEEQHSDFSKTRTDKAEPVRTLTRISAVQRACERTNFSVLFFVAKYFAGKATPPELDIHHVDDVFGENCALVACKTGSVDLIKYLHGKHQADFCLLNKNHESAVQIMAAWSKKRRPKKFLKAFQYLIEEVKVDFVYEYEATLLLLEDPALISYFEGALASKGVYISKKEVEDQYTIKRYSGNPPDREEEHLNKLNHIRGTAFNFIQLFREEYSIGESFPSSIYSNMSMHK